jgi:hypothetical protein
MKRISVVGTVSIAVLVIFALAWAFREHFQSASQLYLDTVAPMAGSEREVYSRPRQVWTDIVRAFDKSGLVGHGTGTASLGLQYILGIDPYIDNVGLYEIEGGIACVLWEWGIIGLLVWFIWTLSFMREIFRAGSLLRGTSYEGLGRGVVLFVFFILFPWFFMGMQVFQNYTNQAFLWFSSGVLFRLSEWVPRPNAEGAAS